MGKGSRKKRAAQTARVPQAPQKPVEVASLSSLDRQDIWWIAGIAIVAFVVYVKTLCPTIYTSGAGENVTAVATLGVPHPPGFPLFCIAGKIFTLLVPLGAIPFRVNLFSALCGAATAGLLYSVCRIIRGIKARTTSALAALLFAFSKTFWSQAVIAEVYTLNALMLTLIFLMILRWERGASFWPVPLVAGLGLTVHPLQLFFFPCWGWLLYTSPRRQNLMSQPWIKVAAVFLAGVSLHLYPFLRSKANPILDWGNPENLRNLFAYITASQYRGRMFTLAGSEVAKDFVSAMNLLFHEFSPWLIPIPFAGAWFAFKHQRRFLIATVTPAVLTVIYAINYNIPWEIEVYYIPVVLVMAFWSAWLPLERIPYSGAACLLAIVPLAYNLYDNDRSHQRIALAYGLDILKTCPRDATLILPETDATFSILYLTAVEKKRPDIHMWVTTEGGEKTLRDGVNPDVAPISMKDLLAQTRGPFLQTQRVVSDLLTNYQQIPYGVLYWVLPKSAKFQQPSIDFQSYELEKFVSPLPSFYLDDRSKAILGYYLLSRGDHDLASGRSSQAAFRYTQAEKIGGDVAEIRNQLGMRFADVGNKQAAIGQLKRSLAVVEDATVHNRLGRLLAESGRTDEAKTEFLRAIEMNPDLAIAHSNLGALYGMQGNFQRAEEELNQAIRLEPNNLLAHLNLARTYLGTGRKEQAAAELRTCLSLDPQNKEARSLAASAGLTL